MTADRPGITTLEPLWCPVPAGPFLMGSAPSDLEASADECPQHQMSLSTYLMSRYPVTNAQWSLFVNRVGGYRPRHRADD